ncbi:MAG: hypothetical protein K8R90_04370 [Candidatus Cloacimonetes bacterium]|nr:hypothetical protein [Candidatus Cloacimonadota bacterium]
MSEAIVQSYHPSIQVNGLNSIEPKEKIVCWLDLMGIAKRFMLSLESSGYYIMKLHIALHHCLNKLDANVMNKFRLYPLLDGAYIVCSVDQMPSFEKFIREVFFCFAHDVVFQKSSYHMYIPRGSVSVGRVIEGSDFQNSSDAESMTHQLGNVNVEISRDYASTLMFGMPISQAYASESSAPPFGLYIHESARFDKFSGQTWFRWFDIREPQHMECIAPLIKKLAEYYTYYIKRHRELGYELEKMKQHLLMVIDYFGNHKDKELDTEQIKPLRETLEELEKAK